MTACDLTAALILIVTDNATDAELIRKHLESEFENIATSTDPARAVQDFELHRPVILCNKDEVEHVYELCKKELFDDYILWP